MTGSYKKRIKGYSGERLEVFIESEVATEHLHRYAFTLDLIQGKKVLDIASGEGYGANLMSGVALEVTGVDIAPEVVAAAAMKYSKANLKFIAGSASAIPLPDKYFDVVVSFETIEHHDRHEEMLNEIKRVLKPGGLLVMSSPDKLNYTDKRNFHNVFHVKELYKDEFKTLIKGHFKHTVFFDQRATFASVLIPESGVDSYTEYAGDYSSIYKRNDFEPMYVICLASDEALPAKSFSVFTDDKLMGRLHAHTVKKVEDTWSYRLGHYALSPFKFLKNIIPGNRR